MKQFLNGKVIDIEVEQTEIIEPIPYEQRVENRIREKYSAGAEFAILRQRDTKPEEFAEYFAYCEKVKAEERGDV